MSLFKCKMCGGSLEISAGTTVIECEYCGTQQTLPKLDDDKRANMYDRANHFRRNNEFDKAMGIYENILNEDNTDAEAYWSLVLCRYGIEYVEDPTSHKRIPTVNRAQFTSIFDDDNYKSALQYADSYQREIYEEEAKTINEIQKGILAISQKEEPFDVFICYKESDNNRRRTPDSVLAQDLYYQLKQEDFKVFFARITLEDKLGSAYEPYIFAALNSAKVMVVLGTKPEFFNAVWVKNEWSRYLALIKQGQKKMLIPAYKDMDPYDLPEEFSHLQAQDMSKLGFMQDLIRGIKKIIKKGDPKPATVIKETVVTSGNTNTAPLLKRAFMFLEDGDWERADDFCEQVLNQDPECAEAYLGKLMAELKVKKQDQLKDCAEPFDHRNNYQKAIRFGDDKLNIALESYIDSIRFCVAEKTYTKAIQLMNYAKNIAEYEKAAKIFKEIYDHKNSKELFEQCLKKVRAIKEQALVEENARKENFKKGLEKFLIRNSQISISAGCSHTIGLKSGGTVVAVGDNQLRQCEVSNWSDIVAISARNHTIGLKSNGTVVAVGYNYSKQCEVSDWSDIVAISAGSSHTVGLKSDGTVVAVGDNEYGKCEVSDWSDIVAISAGSYHTVGLKSDGTVVVVGGNDWSQCEVSNWSDIVAISAGFNHTVGLKLDGTVVVVGDNQYGQCEVSNWSDIVAISAGSFYTVGLKSNGTVVAVGYNNYRQCEVSNWSDIVAISAGSDHTVGLKSNGTVVAVGLNVRGKCKVSSWSNISVPIIADTKLEYENKKIAQKECLKEYLEKQQQYRTDGVCQHCGGVFKGLFSKKCIVCGKAKDY